jgi:hypothetical protein
MHLNDRMIESSGKAKKIGFLWLMNLRKWTLKQEMKTKILVFQPIPDCFTILDKFFIEKSID